MVRFSSRMGSAARAGVTGKSRPKAPEEFTQRAEEVGGGQRRSEGDKRGFVILCFCLPTSVPSSALLCPRWFSRPVCSRDSLSRSRYSAIALHTPTTLPAPPRKHPTSPHSPCAPLSPNIDSPLASSSLSPSTLSQRRRNVASRAKPQKPRPPEAETSEGLLIRTPNARSTNLMSVYQQSPGHAQFVTFAPLSAPPVARRGGT